jgi:hypothetical protein
MLQQWGELQDRGKPKIIQSAVSAVLHIDGKTACAVPVSKCILYPCESDKKIGSKNMLDKQSSKS